MKIAASYIAMEYREACRSIRQGFKGKGFKPVINKQYSLITSGDNITLQLDYIDMQGEQQLYNVAI